MASESGRLIAAMRHGDVEILALLMCATVALVAAPLNSDSAYILVAARRLLAGDRLYVDLIETNPPMSFWLMSIPAAVGKLVVLPDAQLIGLFTAAVLWISTGMTAGVFSTTPDSSRLLRFAVLGSYLGAVVLLALSQVGQREQLAAILFLPYAVLAARATRGHPSPLRLGVSCGVVTGLGLAIKPFFLAPWLAIEFALLITQGRRALARPEVVAAALIQVVYAAAVLAVNPEYLSGMAPLISAYYGAYEIDRLSIMTSNRVLLLAAIGLGAIVVPAWLPKGMASACGRIFGAATLGWVVVFVVQGKGWLYHLLPGQVAATSAVAALGVAAWRTITEWRVQVRWVSLAALLVAAAAVAAGGRSSYRVAGMTREVRGLFHVPKAPDWFNEMSGTVERLAAGQPVYVMSTSVWPAFPIVNLARATWPYHYHFLWPIPSLYAGPGGAAYRLPEDQDRKERAFFDTVVADLVRIPPRLLLVEHGTTLQAMAGRPFDFIAYFSGSPEFRALFQRYRRLKEIDKWDVYELQ